MVTKIKSIKNGPLRVTGEVEIEDATTEKKRFDKKEEAWLCRCGASKNKPYCDGSHKTIEFRADR